MRVRIMGTGGMLGGMAERYFRSLDKYDVQGFNGNNFRAHYNSPNDAGIATYGLSDGDYIINCIGAIKPKFKSIDQILLAIYTNAVFPRKLADQCEQNKLKLIHITTDCVYDGLRGKYTENIPHNATDEYGKSKSLGEPENALVIRTSIIGPEWHGNKRSLMEWLISNAGSKVDGFMNHKWNGLTTLELSKCMARIIDEDLFQWDNFHLYSTDIDKFNLLSKMAQAFDLNVDVHPTMGGLACDRTLRTIKKWQEWLKPSDIDTMLKELAPYASTL